MLTTRAPRLVGQRAADGVDGLEVAQHPAAAVQVGDRPARVLGRVDADADAGRGGVLDVRDRGPLAREVLGLGEVRLRAPAPPAPRAAGGPSIVRPRVEDLPGARRPGSPLDDAESGSAARRRAATTGIGALEDRVAARLAEVEHVVGRGARPWPTSVPDEALGIFGSASALETPEDAPGTPVSSTSVRAPRPRPRSGAARSRAWPRSRRRRPPASARRLGRRLDVRAGLHLLGQALGEAASSASRTRPASRRGRTGRPGR